MIFDLIKSWNWGFQQNIKIVSLNFSHFFTKRITKKFAKKQQKICSKLFPFAKFVFAKRCEISQKFAVHKICHFERKMNKGKTVTKDCQETRGGV